MFRIFPPAGEQDKQRYQSVESGERDYLWFCLEFCNTVLTKRPHHLEALEMAANHFTDLGYYADGLRLDERLAALKPDDPGILYNLSCSLALIGRVEDAFAILARAVAKGYRDYRHMSTDRDLAPLREDPRFSDLLALAAKSGAKNA